MDTRNILKIMKERPVLGDGSYVVTLERRGYVEPGKWTPEAVVHHPEAVTQLHREFLRAGADVLQAFTFYSSDGKLKHAGTECTTESINQRACELVWEVAGQDGPLICGGISPTLTYRDGEGKDAVMAQFKTQCDILAKNKADFLLAEFFNSIIEAEWAIEMMKQYNIPVACTLRIGPTGDEDNVSVGDCAVRMAKAGADIIGLNCNYDPDTCIKTLKLMKERLDQEGIDVFLMAQPLGFHCPDGESGKQGYLDVPDCPLALEGRLISRWDAAKFARDAYDLGVRYIGGCCGFEPYHIRQMSEELSPERGFSAPGVDSYPPGCSSLTSSLFPSNIKRATKDYWVNLNSELTRNKRAAMLKSNTDS